MMLSLSLITLGLATIGAFAKPTIRAAGGLEVSLSTPANNVKSVADLRVVATVKNIGGDDLKILKFGTVLDNKLPTRSFIVNKDGKEVAFIGIQVLVSMTDLSENEWAVIPAGGTVTAEHDVSAVYDFAAAGPGTFTFDPVSTFQVIGLDDIVEAISGTNAGSVSITVTDDVSKRELYVEKRAHVSCPNSAQASFISTSYSEGKKMASLAVSYIRSRGALDPLYTGYFGTNPTSSVISKLSAVANENSSTRILGCSDPARACTPGVIAYTVIATTNIYYCSIFYNQVAPGTLCRGNPVANRNIRGGTTLHELTHAVAGTVDVTYGCSADRALSNPNKLKNADSYNCFAAQAYANTQC